MASDGLDAGAPGFVVPPAEMEESVRQAGDDDAAERRMEAIAELPALAATPEADDLTRTIMKAGACPSKPFEMPHISPLPPGTTWITF